MHAQARRRWVIAGAALLLGAAAVVLGNLWQEQQRVRVRAAALTGGDPSRGPALIARHGCGGCHAIPGIDNADGAVGPSLAGVASRVFLAGEVRNTPDALMQWIRAPHSIDRDTAMPRTGLTPEDARHVAAYLYTLD